jgi:hypothetical protein
MQTQQANSIDMEAVAKKAYDLWVQGGRRDGVAEQNWIEAERIVSSSQVPQSQSAAALKPKSEPPSAARASSAPPMAHSNNKKSMKRH